jgi:hypothetical protein
LLQSCHERVEHSPVSIEREDQRDIDAYALRQAFGDGRESSAGSWDLDEEIGSINQPP